jgi:hypothetical protein
MRERVSNFLIWDMKNVGVLHEKGVSSNSFQPCKVARINLVHCLKILIIE